MTSAGKFWVLVRLIPKFQCVCLRSISCPCDAVSLQIAIIVEMKVLMTSRASTADRLWRCPLSLFEGYRQARKDSPVRELGLGINVARCLSG
jgi:hypothetical protein